MKTLVLATTVALASFSVHADDKAIGLNFLFNSKGFQGVQLQGSVDKMEVHGALLKDNLFAVGAGYRALDTEGNGSRNDDDLSASLAVGGAYVGGTNAGFRPYGQVNVEANVGGNANLNFGAIDYGLGMTAATDGYGYVGMEYEDLEDNDRPAPQAASADRSAPINNTVGESDNGDRSNDDGDSNLGGGDNVGGGSDAGNDSGDSTPNNDDGGGNGNDDDGAGNDDGDSDDSGSGGGMTPVDPPAPTGLGGGNASENGNANGGPHANENAFKPNPGRGSENRNK